MHTRPGFDYDFLIPIPVQNFLVNSSFNSNSSYFLLFLIQIHTFWFFNKLYNYLIIGTKYFIVRIINNTYIF